MELRQYILGVLGGRDGDKHLEDKHSADSALEEKRQESGATAGATSHCGSIVTTGPASPCPSSLPLLHPPLHTPLGMCTPAPALGSFSQDSTALGMQSVSWSPVSFLQGLPTQVFLSHLCPAPVPVSPSTDCVLPLHGSPALLRQYCPMGCVFLSLSVQKSIFGARHARPAGRKHWLSGTICAHGCSFPACSSGVASWLEMQRAVVVSHSTTIWGHELT